MCVYIYVIYRIYNISVRKLYFSILNTIHSIVIIKCLEFYYNSFTYQINYRWIFFLGISCCLEVVVITYYITGYIICYISEYLV